jgi:hypothetical protein
LIPYSCKETFNDIELPNEEEGDEVAWDQIEVSLNLCMEVISSV